MIEVIKNFLGGSLSAVEAWVAGVGVFGIIIFFVGIINVVRLGKKTNEKAEDTQKKCDEKINAFKEQYEKENKEFIETTKKNFNNLADMILIQASKSGIDIEMLREIINIYKDTAIEMLDTDKIEEDKIKDDEEKQTTQEQVNENLNKIDSLMDDLV